MTTDTQKKLLDAIFGSDYGEGLPELSGGWFWDACLTTPKRPDENYAQDLRGRWFERTFDFYSDEARA